MTPRVVRCLVTSLLCLLTPLLALAAGFPYENSDLPVDPAVKWGKLDNGVRYALLPNHEPKGRASLRFMVAAGSLNETENQRGLAHFLEHLAFNGSTHFAPGTLIEYFQRLGMSFGGDTNAYTSFDRTVYSLELPDTKPETFAKAFTLFADYGGGLLLEPASIDKERGIVLSEKRDRDSIEFRQFVGEFDFLLPHSRFVQRMPIGQTEVIEQAQRERFVDFYDTWYRPELITVVVVGDFDPAAIEPALRESLATIRDRAPARPAPSLGEVVPSPDVVARLQAEPEAPAVQIALTNVTRYEYEADTAANRLKYLPRTLALRMLNRRFAILAKQEGATFLHGQIGVTEQYDFFREASIELTCKPAQWQAALATGEQELRRALTHGFTAAELREAVANERNDLDQAVRTAATRRSEELAGELVDTFVERNAFTHPSVDLKLFAPALDRVTTGDCLAALHEAWAEKLGRRIFVTGNLQLDDASAKIVAAYQASQAVAVAAPERTTSEAFAYTQFGPAGKISRQQTVADLGITLVEFANGVRLNLKPTDFEAGSIRVSVRVGGGKLSVPANLPGLEIFAQNTLVLGGLGRHSADELQRLLAGHTVNSGFQVADDAFLFGGVTSKADFRLQLQLLCAYLTDPGYRPEAQRQLRQFITPFYTRLEHTVEGPFELEIPRLLADGDRRFGLPGQAALTSRTADEAKAWLTPEFQHGALEIAIVGDFDPAAAIEAVASTFGTLPARAPKPAYAHEREVAFPAAPLTRKYEVLTEIPKGLVACYWPATDARDVHLTRRLNLLAAIFEDRLRLKLREQMSGAYSPEAAANLTDTYPGYGYLLAQTYVTPAQAAGMVDAIRAISADLHEHGVTADELVRAKQPALTSIRQSLRTNPYWLANVLALAQEQPQRLEWSRNRLSDTEGITAAELTQLAARYLDPAKMYQFISVPTAPSASAAKTAAPGSAPAAKR